MMTEGKIILSYRQAVREGLTERAVTFEARLGWQEQGFRYLERKNSPAESTDSPGSHSPGVDSLGVAMA